MLEESQGTSIRVGSFIIAQQLNVNVVFPKWFHPDIVDFELLGGRAKNELIYKILMMILKLIVEMGVGM